MPKAFHPDPWSESIDELAPHLDAIREFCVSKNIPCFLTFGTGFSEEQGEQTYDFGYIPPIETVARLRAGTKIPLLTALVDLMQDSKFMKWPLIAILTELCRVEEKNRVARGYCTSEFETEENKDAAGNK